MGVLVGWAVQCHVVGVEGCQHLGICRPYDLREGDQGHAIYHHRQGVPLCHTLTAVKDNGVLA
eukprot:9179167-Ditylum_brightwellii.AAC.1